MVQIEILHKIDSDFRPDTDGTYELVAVVETEPHLNFRKELEGAFYYTNHIDSDWTKGDHVLRYWPPCRSSSVGDVFIYDGQFFVVDLIGFKKV